MLWGYGAAGGLGLLLGLRYRVSAVVAASPAVALVSIALAAFAGWSRWIALSVAIGGVFILQCGYLVGLGLTCIQRHVLGDGGRALVRAESGRRAAEVEARAQTRCHAKD